jgi:Fic family protein
MKQYIYQLEGWPQFTWSHENIINLLGNVRNRQGKLIGKMESLGFSLRDEAALDTLTLDILKSTEIEGLFLNPEQVRSSIARKLGMDIAGLVPSDRHVEGVVEMMLDATRQSEKPLNAERLFGWHAALFPTGRSGMYKITTGNWRKDETGPMQVVSGGLGRERVHFQAPGANGLDREMNLFLEWFNSDDKMDPVLKAGIAHIWFVTLHPFDDGNGRIARAITDLQLSRADGSKLRFYSMSAQIKLEQKKYYDILEITQQGTLDITGWLRWFLECLGEALISTDYTLARVLGKARFWEKNRTVIFNGRQRMMINKLLDGIEGKLTSSKWAKMAKCSADTALRDISDLMDKEILRKESAGGRSTHYELNDI